tara:strand:- start:67 stop:672 length:606 start_codon:yes stop_codon:yes gene_type:complete
MATIKPVYSMIPDTGVVDYTLGGKVPVNSDVVSDVGSRFTDRAASAVFTVGTVSALEEGDSITFKSTGGTSYVLTAHDTDTSSTDTTSPTYQIASTKTEIASNMASAIDALTEFSATSDGSVVTVTQATAGEAGNTKVTNSNRTGVKTKSFKNGGIAYDEHDEAVEALMHADDPGSGDGYAKSVADAKLLEHVRKRNLGYI